MKKLIAIVILSLTSVFAAETTTVYYSEDYTRISCLREGVSGISWNASENLGKARIERVGSETYEVYFNAKLAASCRYVSVK